MPDLLSAQSGFVRRMRAIGAADADTTFDVDVLAVARAAVDVLSLEDLESLAGMHILFMDDAPEDVMLSFRLRKRLAEERLKTLRAA